MQATDPATEAEESWYPCFKCGSVWITVDGELLPVGYSAVTGVGSCAAEQRLDGMWEYDKEDWRRFSGYFFFQRLQKYYIAAMSAADVEVPMEDLVMLAQLEFNRLVRSTTDYWRSWSDIASAAKLVESLILATPDSKGRSSMLEAVEAIRRTAGFEFETRQLTEAGSLARVSRVVRGLVNATDHRLLRGPIRIGLPWSKSIDELHTLHREAIKDLADYWDERVLTRVVENDVLWRAVPLGEMVQAVARNLVGRNVTRREFETWCITRETIK